jgi:protein-disulfide isomerase-like protein with CxxC motif
VNIVEHVSVEVRYYSDPACTWSWAAEPALSRIIFQFEGELDFVWAMGGLARQFSHRLNVTGPTRMPCLRVSSHFSALSAAFCERAGASG